MGRIKPQSTDGPLNQRVKLIAIVLLVAIAGLVWLRQVMREPESAAASQPVVDVTGSTPGVEPNNDPSKWPVVAMPAITDKPTGDVRNIFAYDRARFGRKAVQDPDAGRRIPAVDTRSTSQSPESLAMAEASKALHVQCTIVGGGKESRAMVNGTLYEVGDVIDGRFKLLSVGEQRIHVEVDGIRVALTF